VKTELLSFDNISVAHSNTGKLCYVNINIFEGEVIGIIGLKGGGVWKVMELLEGEIKASSGIIRYKGQVYSPNNVYEARRKGIYNVSSQCKLIKNMTISENFFLISEKSRMFYMIHSKSIKIETNNILDKFGVKLEGDIRVKDLTVTQCFFLEIIRAYILNAKVIILHDVLREYNSEDMGMFNHILEFLKSEGVSIIFLDHYYKKIMEHLERIYVLTEGNVSRILYKGEYGEKDLYGFVMGNKYWEQTTGINLGNNKQGNALFEVENLTTKVIKNISFSLKQGGIIGLFDYDYYSGNQLSRALIGEILPEFGNIYIEGKKVEKSNYNKILYKGVNIISHSLDNTLFNDLTVKENVTMTILDKSHWSKKVVNDKVINYAFKELKEYLGDINGDVIVNNLSSEKKTKVQLAKCRLSGAKILVVEHPLLNADLIQGQLICDFIQEMIQKGCGAVIISSSLEYLKNLCDEIQIIKEGKNTAYLSEKEILMMRTNNY